ncbi:MAG: type II toxin-antitoxin system MqsA family antitoxin [Candidatus Edwardsbacteria bacterium]
MLHITLCPSCGSDKLKRVRRNVSGEYHGQSYSVPSLEFYECPACGEKIYDREAMRKIEAYSPAYSKAHAGIQVAATASV